MTQLREFKFVAKLVLVLKKIESEDKTKYDAFYLHKKKQLSAKVTLIVYKQSTLQLYQHTKTFRKWVRLDF